MKKTICVLSAVLAAGAFNANVTYGAPDYGFGASDPGAQLKRANDAMERERVARQIADDEEARKNKVEGETNQNHDEEKNEVTFNLQKVDISESKILTAEEISAVTDKYVGRDVSLGDLRTMTGEINALYEEKGYLTCRAVLPPQRITGGVVTVRLVEGKTGNVSVVGNKHTRKNYITNRFHLNPGEVDNTRQLNKDLQIFNGTNDAQVRLVMKAGQEPGTTDYEIVIYEPKNQSVTLMLDNNGYENTGRFRQGLFYNYRSLTGQRDGLHAQYVRSDGSNAWGIGYSYPLNRKGMKLDLDYTANSTKIKKGILKPLGVEGKARSINITWRVPFMVDDIRRYEAGLSYTNQKSQTDLGKGTPLTVRWVDDKINRFTPYASFTHYGKSSIVYHKHSLVFVNRKDMYGESDNGTNYQLSMFWQKRYNNGAFWQARLDGQLTSAEYLGSSDRFYIGGVNSVRGYEESFLGGEKGISASLEYHVPIDKKRMFRVFTFLDFGTVSGNSAPSADKTLYSGGIGFTANYKQIAATLTLGIPFKKEFEGTKVSSTRFNFMLTGTL